MGRKKLQYALHVMVNEKLREINHNFKKIRIFVLKISSKTVPFLCLSDNTKAVAGVLHVNGVFWATFYVSYQEPITAFMQIPTLYVLTLIGFYFRHLQLVTLD